MSVLLKKNQLRKNYNTKICLSMCIQLSKNALCFQIKEDA